MKMTLPLESEVTIVIAAYNEEKNISGVIEDIKSQQLECRILLIDDCSVDKTYQIAVESGIDVIRHKTNKGYGASLKTGIRNTKTKYVLFFDGDGQHDAVYIHDLIAKADGYASIIGQRVKGSNFPLLRKPGKKLISIVANYLSGKKSLDINSGMRIAEVSIIRRYMHLFSDRFSFTTTMTLTYIKENLDIDYVPIMTKPREGKSSVRFFRDGFGTILLIIRLIMLFDPLKIFLPFSLVLFFLGIFRFSHGLYYGVDNSMTAILGILGGTLIFFFGLLADQLAQLRREINEYNKDNQ